MEDQEGKGQATLGDGFANIWTQLEIIPQRLRGNACGLVADQQHYGKLARHTGGKPYKQRKSERGCLSPSFVGGLQKEGKPSRASVLVLFAAMPACIFSTLPTVLPCGICHLPRDNVNLIQWERVQQ